MCKGFVKIPRRIFEERQWNTTRVYSELDAFIDIYSSACIQDRIEPDGTMIKRNQLVVSYRSLAEKWIWNKSKVDRFLASLERKGYVRVETSKSKTIVTILDFGVEEETAPRIQSETPTETLSGTVLGQQNPDKYRGLTVVSGTLTETPSETPTETVSRAYMNDSSKSMSIGKKEELKSPYNPPRGYEDYDFSYMSNDLVEIVFDWLNYKKERKEKKYTPRGLKIFYHKLESLCNGDAAMAKLITEQSYANNWAGIFQIRDKKYGTANQSTQHNNQGNSSDSEVQQQSLRIIERLSAERRACR